ncbi:MAG: polysaccharide biosynthesis C-terminal domain-containing protein [Chloroflexota bacterium]
MSSRIKTLATDTLIYGFFIVLGRFLTFFLTPLYTNYVSKSVVGDVTYLFALMSIIAIFFTLGMESSFFRYFREGDNYHEKKVFSHSFFIIMALGIVWTSLVMGFSRQIYEWLEIEGSLRMFQYAAMIPIFDTWMVIPYAVLRMNRKAMRFAATRFALIVITVVLNFLFIVYFRYGGEGIFLAQLIASIIGVAIFIPEIIKYFTLDFDWKLLKQMFRLGLPTVPAAFSSVLLQIADRPILKALTNSETVGMFSVNMRLALPMLVFVSVFEYAWKPFYLSNYKEEGSKDMYSRVLTYFTMICAAIFLFTSLFIEYAVKIPFVGGKLINPEYWSGLYIVPIILISYYFNGVFTNLTAGFLIKKKTELITVAVLAAVIVKIGMNFLLIPSLNYSGAAWASVAGYLTSASVLYFYTRKIYPINYEWRRIAILFGLCALTFFPVYLITNGMDSLPAILIRIASLVLFGILLKASGFFTQKEIAEIKRLFRRSKPAKATN